VTILKSFSTLEELFAEQARCRMENDLDGMVETYHPGAIWMRFPGPVVGRPAIRALLADYWRIGLVPRETHEYVQTDDLVMIRATLEVDGQSVVTFGAYVMQDGLVWRHFGADEGGSRDWWGGQSLPRE